MSASLDCRLYVRVKSCESGYKLFELADGHKVNFRRGSESASYIFDRVFSCTDGQTRLYETVARKAAERLVDGFSSMVMCYGAPGSGKSYTLVGKIPVKEPQDTPSVRESCFSAVRKCEEPRLSGAAQLIKNNERGLLMRCVDYLFEKAGHYENYKELTVSASFLELNKDGIVDLAVKCQDFGRSGYHRSNAMACRLSL